MHTPACLEWVQHNHPKRVAGESPVSATILNIKELIDVKD
jgi:hypothetical protein